MPPNPLKRNLSFHELTPNLIDDQLQGKQQVLSNALVAGNTYYIKSNHWGDLSLASGVFETATPNEFKFKNFRKIVPLKYVVKKDHNIPINENPEFYAFTSVGGKRRGTKKRKKRRKSATKSR